MKPTRCCVQTQKGTRCANEPSPVRPSRMIGPVRLAACGLEAHQRALWSLPGFIRHDAYCGAFGCDRPSNAGICPKHRDQYRDFGITEHMLLAQEAPMTEPTPLSKLPELGFARIQVQTSGASLADLEAAVAKVTPPAAPQETADGGATPSPEAVAGSIDWRAPPATVEEFLRDLESGDGEPSEGDVADAQLFVGGTDAAPAELVARWGQVHTAPVQPMSADLDGLAALAARGQQPTAPGSTVAELHAVCLLMQRLGSYGPDASAMLMRLLPVESRRALLEIEAADARGELARARANVVTPPPPEKLAEYAAKVAEIEAKIAALDAGEVRE